MKSNSSNFVRHAPEACDQTVIAAIGADPPGIAALHRAEKLERLVSGCGVPNNWVAQQHGTMPMTAQSGEPRRLFGL